MRYDKVEGREKKGVTNRVQCISTEPPKLALDEPRGQESRSYGGDDFDIYAPFYKFLGAIVHSILHPTEKWHVRKRRQERERARPGIEEKQYIQSNMILSYTDFD